MSFTQPSPSTAQSAADDAVRVTWNAGATGLDLLANDDGRSPGSRLAIVATTTPAHGTLALAPGGRAVVYTPTPGWVGADTITYTMTDTFQVADIPRQTLATVGGVPVLDGYGSALARVDGTTSDWWVMTDRGPTADAPGGGRTFVLADYAPRIARFSLVEGVLTPVGAPVILADAGGRPRTGIPPPAGAGGTGEVAYDETRALLPPDPNGIDPEGLVAMADGTFWVADEYGPFLVHFAADGTTLEQVTPFSRNGKGHVLPAVLATRDANKGMEGLTVTPDGARLIGLMQNSLGNGTTKSSAALRVVTYDIVNDATHAEGATHQYLYVLDDPRFGCSEIAAVADPSDPTGFVLFADERDGRFPGDSGNPSVQKKIYRFSLAGATDVSDPGDGPAGLLVGGTTIEDMTGGQSAAQTRATLVAAGVTPAAKTLVVDLLAEFANAGRLGTLYPHDKIEGMQVIDGGRRLVLSNDDDFGVAPGSTPFSVVPKVEPAVPSAPTDGTQLLFVDLQNLPARPATATVQIDVEGPDGVLHDALTALTALRGLAARCRRQSRLLGRAVTALARGVSRGRFIREPVLGASGGKLFAALAGAVRALSNAADVRTACVEPATLRTSVATIVSQARAIASAAITGTHAAIPDVTRAKADVAAGDGRAAAGDAARAIDAYARAWRRVGR